MRARLRHYVPADTVPPRVWEIASRRTQHLLANAMHEDRSLKWLLAQAYINGLADVAELPTESEEGARTVVDNQHKQIKGYRDLSTEEIATMNEIKTKAEECGQLCARLKMMAQPSERPLDVGLVERGTNHLQEGFMLLVRSVAQPTTF